MDWESERLSYSGIKHRRFLYIFYFIFMIFFITKPGVKAGIFYSRCCCLQVQTVFFFFSVLQTSEGQQSGILGQLLKSFGGGGRGRTFGNVTFVQGEAL